MTNLVGDSNDPNVAAVFGIHTAGAGAVIGQSDHGRGVIGISDGGQGVWGASDSSTGVVGVSKTGWGTSGESETQFGVAGISKSSAGVRGTSVSGRGAEGVSADGEGVVGFSTNSAGVWGEADGAGNGVQGTSKSGVGVFGKGGRLAGLFEGKVTVTGDLTAHDVFIAGGDCAEEFDIAEAAESEPGMVMVLNQEGTLQPGQQAYDKRVAGVISGAGAYKPGVILDRRGSSEGRMPVALVGKVYCKVDAQYGSIETGDLLTSSPTPGHAMKASDPFKAFGAVIGKALGSLDVGQGLIPILIALQ
jgi:hypothetical protein